MENIKVSVPDGCSANVTREGSYLVISFEPKNGDVVAFGKRPNDPSIGIFKSYDGNVFRSYATVTNGIISLFEFGWVKDNIRLATDSEKQHLFDTLAKEGKRWNAEEKRIEKVAAKIRKIFNESDAG